MKIRGTIAVTLVSATFSLSAGAQGQPWVQDRRYGEGIGIRAGNLEFHPSIAGEVGYDSNYFHRSADEDPADAIRIRTTLSATLSTLGPQRATGSVPTALPVLNFSSGASIAYNELIALDSQDSDGVSDQRHFSGGLNLALDLLPGRPVGFDLSADYARIVEPSNDFVLTQAFDRGTIQAGAGVTWRPGGGLFEWRLGYELNYNYFEERAFRDLENIQHFFKTRGRWRFLPRTALLYDASYGMVNYVRDDLQNSGELLEARIGLNGLVTHHFALLAMVGWAQSYYESQPGIPARNYDDFIAQAEVKWFILPSPTIDPSAATVGLSSVALGYQRQFQNSYLGDFYRRDRGYLKFEYFIGGRALVVLDGGVSHNSYPESFQPPNEEFTENRVDATLFGEFRFSDVFAVNATFRYLANITDEEVVFPGGGSDQLEFDRYEAWLGARLFW